MITYFTTFRAALVGVGINYDKFHVLLHWSIYWSTILFRKQEGPS